MRYLSGSYYYVVNSVQLDVLRAVRRASKEWSILDGWVTSYDIGGAMEHRRMTVCFLALSMLPPMAREGLLDTLRKPGCTVLYRLSEAGKSALRRKPNKDGYVTWEAAA